MSEILKVENLKKYYSYRRLFRPTQFVRALDGVSFELGEKETLAIVGESGCGKSTLAKTLMQIEEKTEGQYSINGKNVDQMKVSDFRRSIQMIFQDPYSSINPRKKAWEIVAEPLVINSNLSKAECKDRALEEMQKVGLHSQFGDRFPHMFSGGQRQRLGVARALILQPKILICDEPVSALDVSIQAQVINMLMDLQDQNNLSYLFISHDLSVVRHLADRIMVMYLGKIVEYGTRDQIFKSPQHPYTRALLASTPQVHKTQARGEFQVLKGELPSPINPPSGCAFHKRCEFSTDMCSQKTPEDRVVSGRRVSCHNIESIS